MPEIFTLETGRLTIQPFVADDLEAPHAIMNDCFGEQPLEERRRWIDWSIMNYAALARLHQSPYGDRAVALKATGKVIGIVGFVPAYGPFDTLLYFQARSAVAATGLCNPEMGLFWALAPEHCGRGYATEAAQALVEYGFSSLKLKHMVAMTEDDNASSIAVMKRLGMVIQHNPERVPEWFQVIGILENPAARPTSA